MSEKIYKQILCWPLYQWRQVHKYNTKIRHIAGWYAHKVYEHYRNRHFIKMRKNRERLRNS